jgi:hypothetical protein
VTTASLRAFAVASVSRAVKRRMIGYGVGLGVAGLGAVWNWTVGAPEESAAPAPAAAPAATPTTAPIVSSAAAPVTPATPRPVTSTANVPAGATAPRDGERADTVKVVRELFGYLPAGRRDPYRPLISTNALRPLPAELRLTAVAFDPSGVQSVAILRDITTQQQHRVRAGQVLGRMRILRIRPKAIVFAIEELGFSRTEELTLQESTATRPQP